MIRVVHGDEPPSLAKQRGHQLARLERQWVGVDADDAAAVDAYRSTHDKEFDKNYRRYAWGQLCKRWRHKCAYCEATLHKSDPVDHFRPRRPNPGEHGGYWWLTWSWRNLLPACTTCNGAKGDKFPVESGRLRPWDDATEGESAVFIDPSREDPSEHLEFFREEIEGRERWTLQGKANRGRITVQELGLDADDERYYTHLELLAEVVRDFKEALARGSEKLAEVWARKMRVFFAERTDEDALGQPFSLLSQAYLRYHFGDIMRAHGLVLPPLGDPAPMASPALGRAASSWPPEIDETLRRDITAMTQRPSQEETLSVLRRLLAIREWTTDELAALLPQSAETLKNSHIALLVRQGEVVREGRRVRALR